MNGLFLSFIITAVFSLASPETGSALTFELLSVSRIKNGPDETDRLFKPLDTVWIGIRVGGFVKNERHDVAFQADIRLVRSDGSIVMEKDNILDQRIPAPDIEKPELNLTFNIDLYESITPGRYSAIITMRDMNAKKTGTYTVRFTVQK